MVPQLNLEQTPPRRVSGNSEGWKFKIIQLSTEPAQPRARTKRCVSELLTGLNKDLALKEKTFSIQQIIPRTKQEKSQMRETKPRDEQNRDLCWNTRFLKCPPTPLIFKRHFDFREDYEKQCQAFFPLHDVLLSHCFVCFFDLWVNLSEFNAQIPLKFTELGT